MPDQPQQQPRRFMFAPVMEKLQERVEAAEKAAEEARELLDGIEDADDAMERLCWVIACARDVKRGLKSVDELQEECNKVVEGIKGEIPDAAWAAVRAV